MTIDISSSLISKLNSEAKLFVEERTASKYSKPDLCQAIASLTGIYINADANGADLKFQDAKRKLQAGLRQERKNGRAGSPLYDSNRHIALNETMKQISAIETKIADPSVTRAGDLKLSTINTTS